MEREATYGTQSRERIIAAWPRLSSAGTTTYEIQLHSDGVLTCDCPGWVRRATRDCKHVKELKAEATRVLRGQSAPRFPATTSRTPITNMHEIRRNLNTSELSKRTSKTAQEQTKRLLNLG